MNPGVELYVENVAQGRASKNDDYDRPIAEGRMRVVNGRWVTSKGRTEPIVKFKGCSDRTIRGGMIGRRSRYIGAESRAEIEEEDAFTVQDLDGWTVIMHEGEREVVGIVEDTLCPW